jgi:hypothetical protein
MASPEPLTPDGEIDSRSYRGPDRRGRPTPRFSRYTMWGGRRKGGRRTAEAVNTFVDQYSTRMWGLMIWIAAMNAGDSFFTLFHLQGGGIELNPVAELMLETGRVGFVALKSFLITVPLVVLCLHKNFSLARLGLWIAAGTYTVLLSYHVMLL